MLFTQENKEKYHCRTRRSQSQVTKKLKFIFEYYILDEISKLSKKLKIGGVCPHRDKKLAVCTTGLGTI